MGNILMTRDEIIHRGIRRNKKIPKHYVCYINDDFIKRNWRYFSSQDRDVLCEYHSCFSESFFSTYCVYSDYWNWKKLSLPDVVFGSYFTASFISEYHYHPWDWKAFTRHPQIKELVEKFPDKPFDWDSLSISQSVDLKTGEYINSRVSLSFIEKYPEKEWNWGNVTRFATEDFINSHLDKPFDWEFLSTHRNLSIPFILRHKNRLNLTSKNIQNTLDRATEKLYRERKLQEQLEILEKMYPPSLVVESE